MIHDLKVNLIVLQTPFPHISPHKTSHILQKMRINGCVHIVQ